MSVEAVSSTELETIYVRLLNEGTDAFRPVPAAPLREDVYELSPSFAYDSEDEEWEFLPGSRVHVSKRHGNLGEFLVAESLAEI